MRSAFFLVVFVFVHISFGFAQTDIQATGTGTTQSDAQERALQALASQLKVTVYVERNSQKSATKDSTVDLYTSRSSTKTNMTLLGVKFKSNQSSSGWEVRASLDKSAAPLYQEKIASLTKSIQTDLAMADSQANNEDKVSLLLAIQNNFVLREGYVTVASQLGVKTFPKLDLTENQIAQRILAVEQANQQKLEMSIDPLVNKGSLSSSYAEEISGSIRSGIIAMNRFDVKESGGTNQTLKMTLAKNSVTTVPSTSDSYGYCTVDLTLIIEIRDNKSKKIVNSKEVQARGSDSSSKQRSYDVDVATQNAVNRLISEALAAMELTFVIQGRLTSVEPSGILVLSKGSEVGVKQGMDFEIYDPSDRVHQTKIAVLRVSDVSPNSSKGSVYKVVRADIPYGPGFSVVESKTDNGFQALVVKRGYSDVHLNVGRKMKVSQGDYFAVVAGDAETLIDPATGLPIRTESSTHGRIQITQVFDEYSIAKIEDGVFTIRPNDTVRQIQRGPWVWRLSVQDSVAYYEVAENRNKTSTGLYYGPTLGGSLSEKTTNYVVQMVQASFGVVDELWNYYLSAGLKYTNISSAPGVFGTNLRAGYDIPLVPGYLAVFGEGSAGIAFASQSAGYLSGTTLKQAPSQASSVGLDVEARVGVCLSVGSFALRPAVGATSMTLSSWKYNPNPGDSSSELVETSAVRYPRIQAAPVTVSVSMDYTF